MRGLHFLIVGDWGREGQHGQRAEAVRFCAALSFDGFAIVHAGLHRRLEGHPAYAFDTAHSRLLIYGAAVLALLHLALLAPTV